MSARDTPLATDPLAGHRIADVPFYQPAGAEADWFETACRHHLPVLLKGPTGCGKTRFVEYMAWRMGLPLIQVACNDDTSAADLTGRHLLDADGTYWADGPLTLAARHGAICYLDEIVEARPDATVVIHPLTDSRRVLPLDRLGEVVHAHPDFHLVISYNPGYHGEHRRLKPSTRQRFVAIDFGYPDAAHEADVVVRESGADRETARRLVDLAQRTRALALAGNGLDEGASTRLLVHAARLIVAGLAPLDACRIAISDAATDDADTRAALQTMAAAYFAT
ncbi:CbbQ/NirQ/NorQ/GpvN family protein [Burkholderia cepacia]|uniref:CbbQ/NirQ/NorQ/GpvN family protein n=1 Tax=Burkholderia cepacia TaxID=292 RepID=UPI0007572D84|nr:CbbQ/NirQ/NorQ/GpvN family protein [Burkholderia cepacia]EMD9440374.1 CbbQ/NirQ/NorQ/GpvN family protein [Burkholderia cepacia]KVX53105.1 AAA family ATPase [Burkholderia cepacia]